MAEFTREQASGWWLGLDAKRRQRWAPVIRAMTEAQREEFHRERRDTMARFQWPADSGPGDHERAAAEARALEVWAKRVGVAVEVPPVEAFLTELVRVE